MELQPKKRFAELADKAYASGQYTFTDFLGMADKNLFFEFIEENKHICYESQGGYEAAERQMIRFGNSEELLYEQTFPIICIKVEPLLKKFSDDFSHRDFLGAIMNLGIERSMLGDILIRDREAYVFIKDTMAEYLCNHLEKVKHTHVKCNICKELPDICVKEPIEETHIAASDRTDAVVAKVCNLSRSQSQILFREKKIFINGRICENNSNVLKEGDVISIRGFGKIIYDGIQYTSKKGRLCISIRRFC